MIELRGVAKHFSGVPALDGVDLHVPTSHTTVLIGPSGCGKSTLLRMMLGLTRPDRGSVVFDGTELNRDTVQTVRRRTGYVIQDGGLFPHMTAVENVTLMARQLSWSRQRIDKRLDELVTLTRFPGDGLERHPVELSGGQRQRVALMRALMLDPVVLLLDEPLGALDPMIRSDLQHDLRRIFKELAKTVVLVTHDLAEADFFGGRIVLLREGHVVQQGTLSELIDSPVDEFVTRFVTAQRLRFSDDARSKS
jgi:osmoprotectant transport system ATP-binding protein